MLPGPRSRLRLVTVVAVIAAGAACGDSPSGPSGGGPITVSATLTNTVTKAPIGSDTRVTALPALLEFSQPGFITRSAWITSAQPTVDLIPDTPPFSLDYYRQFVRGSLDESTLQPVRRWTRPPMVYFRTVDESGAAVPASLIDATERTIAETMSAFTGGTIGVGSFDRGSGTREGQPGWLTVKWPTNTAENICGRATIGQEGGYIEFFYTRGGSCACGPLATRPRTVRHELGHAMGFWHTNVAGDIMNAVSPLGCDGGITERERYHAAIAYTRQPGNRDVDVDPAAGGSGLRSTDAGPRSVGTRFVVIDD